MHIDLIHLIEVIGYYGILLIIFLETGLFFGFFLPGDSLLFTAGLLASQKIFNIWTLVPSIIVTAILGYQLGYWFGKRLGRWLLRREESFWFKRQYVEDTRDFYYRHGGKALILGRLMPVVRTFVPIVAGMIEMSRQRYILLNVSGALLWAGGITITGYYLGQIAPGIQHYILPLSLSIIIVSILPAVWRYFRTK